MSVARLRYADLAKARLSPEPMPRKRGGLSGRFVLPPDFPEVRLFALLKWRFGGPNGPITFLGPKGGDPDAPFKWDFLFVPVEPLKLQLIRTVVGIEVWCWGADASREDIIGYLQNNLSRHADVVDKAIGSLEEYTLLINPCARYRSIMTLCLQELNQADPSPPTIPANIQVGRQIHEELGEEFSAYLRAVDRQALFSILLVSASAFMAEAYLNLVLAVLLREEIRSSKRLLKDTLQRPWRTKIERLPADCRFIVRAPDLDDPRIREAQSLFELRNRIAHPYPDRKRFKVGTMWFQESFPVLPTAVPFHQYAFALSNQFPSAAEARQSKVAAENLVEFLGTHVCDTVARELEMMARANPLGYNETKRIFGIPFGNWVIISSGTY